jgi:uncharacterized membrane protein YdbT with pleckstrin-like domain
MLKRDMVDAKGLLVWVSGAVVVLVVLVVVVGWVTSGVMSVWCCSARSVRRG